MLVWTKPIVIVTNQWYFRKGQIRCAISGTHPSPPSSPPITPPKHRPARGGPMAFMDGPSKRVQGCEQAGFGIFYVEGDRKNHSASVPQGEPQTNNRGELRAVLYVLHTLHRCWGVWASPTGPPTGVSRPGSTTLILGPPRSGKSSLMKAIAGTLTETNACFSGSVTYGGRHLRDKRQPPGELKLERLVGYVPQTDEHLPTLTVRETLEFAHACTSKIPAKVLLRGGPMQQQQSEAMTLDRLLAEIVMAQVPLACPDP